MMMIFSLCMGDQIINSLISDQSGESDRYSGTLVSWCASVVNIPQLIQAGSTDLCTFDAAVRQLTDKWRHSTLYVHTNRTRWRNDRMLNVIPQHKILSRPIETHIRTGNQEDKTIAGNLLGHGESCQCVCGKRLPSHGCTCLKFFNLTVSVWFVC